MSKSKKKKIRTEFRKNRSGRARPQDLTRKYEADELAEDQAPRDERVSGKGALSRKRTVIGSETDSEESGLTVQLDVDESLCITGRVLCVQGLISTVESGDGTVYRCTTRGLLKSLTTDQRNVVVAGDRVMLKPAAPDEGIIQRVEPRHGVLSRTSRGRQHVIVTNVDRLVIVSSSAEPEIKPNLIDRMLVTAQKANIEPVICINKVDLVDPANFQPLIGVYARMGYQVLMTSVTTGQNIGRLRQMLVGCESVVTGQSGVGKSSLLNSVDPDFDLRVSKVSSETQKGRHTTTTAQLIPLNGGGYVVDTPGIRQFALWDVTPEEIAGFYRDVRPYVSLCRFPNCTHTHEADCAVKDAVADGRLDARRYESFCHLMDGRPD